MGTLVVGSLFAAVSSVVAINQNSSQVHVTNGTSTVVSPMNKGDVRGTA